jgi:hypothetical protein
MSVLPRQTSHADWLRDFLDLSRQFLGLNAPTFSDVEKPAECTPPPSGTAGSSEIDGDEE